MLHQPGDVLAHNIEFKVDHRTRFQAAEIGVLHRVGDDGHPETARFRVADRQAHAVHRHRTLLDRAKPAALGFVLEREVPTAVGVFLGRAPGRLVHMPLHDMAVQQRIGLHGPFEVDQVADLEQPQITPVESLFHSRHRVGVALDAHDRQTYAVMGYALVDFQLLREVRAECEVPVLTVRADSYDFRRPLHDA